MLRGRNIKIVLPLSHNYGLFTYSELYNPPQATNRTFEVLRVCMYLGVSGLRISVCGLSDQILVIYSFKV